MSWQIWFLIKYGFLIRVVDYLKLKCKNCPRVSKNYRFLILSTQTNARFLILGNNAKALDIQSIFASSFEDLVIKVSNFSNIICRYQDVLQHAGLKVDFNVGRGVYMLPSNMQLRMSKVAGFNNEVFVWRPTFKLDHNTKVNHCLMAQQKQVLSRDRLAAQHEYHKQKQDGPASQ